MEAKTYTKRENAAALVLPQGCPLNWWKSPCINLRMVCASAGRRWKHRHPLPRLHPPTLW